MAFLNFDEAKNSLETMEATSVMVCWLSECQLSEVDQVFETRMLIIYTNVFVRVWCIGVCKHVWFVSGFLFIIILILTFLFAHFNAEF